jgi:hypothetical protein
LATSTRRTGGAPGVAGAGAGPAPGAGVDAGSGSARVTGRRAG